MPLNYNSLFQFDNSFYENLCRKRYDEHKIYHTKPFEEMYPYILIEIIQAIDTCMGQVGYSLRIQDDGVVTVKKNQGTSTIGRIGYSD